MAFTAPAEDLLDAPKSFRAPDDEIVKSAFVAPPEDRIDFSKIVASPAGQRSQFSSGLSRAVPLADNPDWDFTKATRGGLPGILSDAIMAAQQKVIEPAATAALKFIAPELEPEAGKPLIPDSVLPLAKEKGVIPALTRTLQGFTTPGNLLTLPLAAESKLLQAGYLTGAASSIPDSIQKIASAQTPEETRDAAAELGINVAMSAALGKGLSREPVKENGNSHILVKQDALNHNVQNPENLNQPAQGFTAPADEVVTPAPPVAPADATGVVRHPDGSVDQVTTALNKLRQTPEEEVLGAIRGKNQESMPLGQKPTLSPAPDQSSTAGQFAKTSNFSESQVAPTIAQKAAANPTATPTMADLAAMVEEIKGANPFKPPETTNPTEIGSKLVDESPKPTPAEPAAVSTSQPGAEVAASSAPVASKPAMSIPSPSIEAAKMDTGNPFKAGDKVIHQGVEKTIARIPPNKEFVVIGNRAIPVRELTPVKIESLTPAAESAAKVEEQNYNLAILSGDEKYAYVSELGKPETTKQVSAKTPAELIKLLGSKYKLSPTPKGGVFKSFDVANKEWEESKSKVTRAIKHVVIKSKSSGRERILTGDDAASYNALLKEKGVQFANQEAFGHRLPSEVARKEAETAKKTEAAPWDVKQARDHLNGNNNFLPNVEKGEQDVYGEPSDHIDISPEEVAERAEINPGMDADEINDKLIVASSDLAHEQWLDHKNEINDEIFAEGERYDSARLLIKDAIEKELGVGFKGSPSAYANYKGLKLRLSDHAQVPGGGFNLQTDDRMGEADIQWILEHDEHSHNAQPPTKEQIRAVVAKALRNQRSGEPEPITVYPEYKSASESGVTTRGDKPGATSEPESSTPQSDIPMVTGKATSPQPSKSVKSKANELADKLESLKTGIGKGGQLHAFGLAADLWDRAVSIAQGVIRAGGSIAEAITAAIAHIKENHKGEFEEEKARFSLMEKAQTEEQARAGEAKPERERAASAVKSAIAESEAKLKDLVRESVTPTKGQSKKERQQAMYQETARYRTLRDELLHHPEYIAEQITKQNDAITEANKILEPHKMAIRPDDFPNLEKLRDKLTPEQFKRLQELSQEIEASHGELVRMPKKMVSRIYGEMQDDGRLSKSAPFMPNAGRSLDHVTDWLRANGVDSPKKSLAERMNIASKFADTLHNVKTSAQKALLKAQALWKAAVETYKHLPTDTDFRHVIKSWIYSDQRTGLATHQFVKELVAKVPNADRRKAMSIWLDADGDKSLLQFQSDSVPDAYRKPWELAMKLTDDEKQLAMKIKQDFEAKLDDGQKVGIIDQGRADYGVPQRWKIKPEPAGDPSGERKGTPGNPFARLDSRSPFFSFQRETPSYYDGIMSKGVPENLDIAHLVATYDQAFHKSLSSRGMIGALQEAKAKDGLPVVKISGSARQVSNDGGKTYFVDSKTRSKSDVSADGRPYQPVDHSSLRGWAARFKDDDGNPIMVKGDMLVHPDHVKYLENELVNSGLRDVPFVGGLMQTQAFLKASKLSASAFHLMTIGEHMASHLVNPFLGDFKIDLRKGDQSLLVRNGLELGMSGPQAAFAEGLAGGHGGLFNKIPGLGDLSAKMTDWMFKDYIPTIMMKTGLHVLEANRKRYGDKLTPDQIAELTARQMNAAGGLLNKRLAGADGNFWGQLGANKTVMDLNRMALMAPQFLEARLRVVGQALKPYGAEQRKMLILQVGILYVGARVLNQLLDDDPHWHDNPFSVVYKGRAYSIRTIVGDFYHLLNDPASFAAGRLAPLTKILMEDAVMGGRDLRTGARKDVPFDTQSKSFRMAQNMVMDLANWLTPIPAEGLLPGAAGKDQSIAGMALSSGGVGSRKFSAVNQVRDLAADFNRNSPDAKAKNFQSDRDSGSFGHSDYAKLDALLDAGDTAKAAAEYKALLAEGKTPALISARYDRTIPFTGNHQREMQFVNSLTPEQKATYKKARAEQQSRQDAFKKLPK